MYGITPTFVFLLAQSGLQMSKKEHFFLNRLIPITRKSSYSVNTSTSKYCSVPIPSKSTQFLCAFLWVLNQMRDNSTAHDDSTDLQLNLSSSCISDSKERLHLRIALIFTCMFKGYVATKAYW